MSCVICTEGVRVLYVCIPGLCGSISMMCVCVGGRERGLLLPSLRVDYCCAEISCCHGSSCLVDRAVFPRDASSSVPREPPN